MAETQKYDYKKGSTDAEFFRDSIATVDASGHRKWLFPKQQKGRYFKYRTYVSYVLLAFFFAAPWIRIGDQPLLLINLFDRRFVILGQPFWTQDFHLFVLAMITGIIFIVLFTVVYGRLFCGWVCPQTIFMEGVFRKIDYWIEGTASQQKRLSGLPWSNAEKIRKRGGKLVLYYAISFLIGNTFLMYLIGTENWLDMATQPPASHSGYFTAMVIFSFAFFFVFAYLREQVCTAICPYGRLQGVMLDKDSIVVAYDYVRGEPRGKGKKRTKVIKTDDPASSIQKAVDQAATISGGVTPQKAEQVIKLGDCIDCGLCVKVCPTGIDIRNGTQLECINCTLCIDACDEVMERIDQPKGLIRYASQNNIEQNKVFQFTTRMKAYSAVLVVLIGILAFSLTGGRAPVEATILRTPGTLFYPVDENTVSNLYNIQVTNKTTKEIPIRIEIENFEGGRIKMVGQETIVVPKQEITKGGFFIELPIAAIKQRKTKVVLGIYQGERRIARTHTNFLYK